MKLLLHPQWVSLCTGLTVVCRLAYVGGGPSPQGAQALSSSQGDPSRKGLPQHTPIMPQDCPVWVMCPPLRHIAVTALGYTPTAMARGHGIL